MPDRLHEALVYRAHGFHPIPFYPHSKTPAFAEGEIFQYRTKIPSTANLKRWFIGADRNIGLITGVKGFHILDIDGEAGYQSLSRLPSLPKTPTLITGRGAQYYFQGNETLPTKQGLLPGIDFLSSDHQALTASSVHPDGPVYHFADGLSLVDVERALVPAWVFELLSPSLGAIHQPTPLLERGRDHGNSHNGKESRNLTSGAPVLLETVPTYKSLNPLEVLQLFGDFGANQCVAAYLGLPRLGSKFLCFYHPERRPSMTLYVDKHTGAWKVHDWHERGVHEHYGLADIFASHIIGQEVRLEGSPTLTIWWLRSLITAGYLAPADVPAKPLPFKVRPAVRTLYDGFILNLQCKWLSKPGTPTPYTRDFAKAWCGMKSNHVVEEGIYWLRCHGYMRYVGRQHGSQVFLPGEGE
jgi:hypothetical protein